jgi:hypothetical protein
MCSPPSMANNPALCSAMHGHLGNEMPAGPGGIHVGPATGLCQALMPVAQRFTPHPVPAPFPARDDGRIVVPGRYEDQPPRPPTVGGVYPRTARGRRQLPDHTVAHRDPAKTRGR